MKRRLRPYIRLNLMSLFLIAISFMSITFAWFAYSGLASLATEVDVKAWYIQLEKNGEKISNDIVISLSELYPGMETVTEIVKIQNLGDSNAEVNYAINSARILGDASTNYQTDETTTSKYVEDLLSHNFPFKINISLTKNYALAGGDESIFEISISWPLDSDTNDWDSEWGTKAYNFQKEEANKKKNDSNYQVRPSVQVVISLTAEQYLEAESSSDVKYGLGEEILVDVINKTSCSAISPTCLKTYVIDVNNTLGDQIVTLLPNPYNSYISTIYNDYNTSLANVTNGWTVDTRPLVIEDIMKIISTDVQNSLLIRDDISNSIIGNLMHNTRMTTELNKAISYQGYYQFNNDRFWFLPSSECYWIQSGYDSNKAFALKRLDENISMVYGNEKEHSCKVIPIILASKADLY